ncbi:CDC48 family AAA ATPase [Candidatus Woesearchaeota archaeon]|nr:CDC48 family AAA ATPase [Candidatus Woesearchaeota archaeon]
MVDELKLKVAEAIQEDVNKGIVRIDSSYMRKLDIRPGNIVQITGERATVGIADRALPGDIGLNVIRMDGIIRRNAKTSIGESVAITRVDVKPAKNIVIAPAREGIMIRTNNPTIFKRGLLGRAVMKGDLVALGGTRRRQSTLSDSPFADVFSSFNFDDAMNFPGFGLSDLKFSIVDVEPKKAAVLITEDTRVEYSPTPVEMKEDQPLFEVSYEDIGGLEDELSKVREMVELPLKNPELFDTLGIEPPKGVLLHGPPGTGKTLLAKAVANETNSNFILINGPEIMSKYYGQSEENLRKKFEEAEKNAPSIIFIDEIDAIASKREESKGEVERRVVAQLLAIMDGLKSRGKVIVIAATNIPNSLDPALRRPGRFDRELEINVPQKGGRLNILKIHTRNMPLGDDVNLEEIANITHGFVGADLASLAKEAAMTVLRRILPKLDLKDDEPIPRDVLDKIRIKRKDFKEALKTVRPSALREVLLEVPNTTWDDVGGLEDVKQELKEALEWPLKHGPSFRKLGIKPPKGVLLYGPPGTGKTLLAKAVAKESEANFILVKGPELLSKWVGESEKAVREVFKKARQASPTIIFFDEIDSLAPRRSGGAGGDSHSSERVVNQLLTEMDGLQELNDIVIVAATNRPDILDTALLRPGRFDRILLVPSPGDKAREQIFRVHTKDMPLAKNVDFASLVKKTDGYAGADIESICREAAILALREDMKANAVKMKHFEAALDKVRPSVNKEVEQAYEDLQKTFRRARAEEMKENRPSYYG